MKLFSYFRSSASYRVRIGLGIKGIERTDQAVNLVANEQQSDTYRKYNEQRLVPALMLDSGEVIGQSTAILEWLEESHPEPPLYPRDAVARARMRACCQHIACDMHPLNNLRVLRYLKGTLGQPQEAIDAWYAHWIHTGFTTLEPVVAKLGGRFSLGERPGMLEVFIVPQVYNARRFAVDLEDYEAIRDLEARCLRLGAFRDAHPDHQPDTPA